MNKEEFKTFLSEMNYVITAAVLIFGYVAAQDSDCDYRQNVSTH